MTCLETLEYISRHFDGDLSQSEENELKKHIESCESCRREFEDMQQIFAELKNEKQAELPSNFHEELMEKLENQKVVPLKTAKKNKINYRKYMAAAASFIVLAIVGVILGVKPTIYLLQAPVALIIILILSYGSGMFLATIGVFFRDIEYLWSVALMLIMYTCAIFYYPSKLLKSGWAWILKFNPLYCTIQIFRSAIFGEPMYAPYVIYAAAFSVVITIIGLVCFKKKQDNFILYI